MTCGNTFNADSSAKCVLPQDHDGDHTDHYYQWSDRDGHR